MFKRIGLLICLTILVVGSATPIAPRTPIPIPEGPTTTTGLVTPIGTAVALPSPQATTVTLPDDVLFIYHKSGGVAGIDETLVVGQGGLLELDRRGEDPKTLKLDEPMMLPIRNLYDQVDFGAFDPMYGAVGADLFTYTITARTPDGQVKTVTAMDGAKLPNELGQLISMLELLRGMVK